MKIKANFEFEIAREFETKTRLQLKTKFYKYHTEKDRKGFKHGIIPNALVLNPQQLNNGTFNVFAIDTWYAVYCRGFYVTIEQSGTHQIVGPHAAKLHLQIYGGNTSRVGKFAWLGTTQFIFPFFDQIKLHICLRRAIRLREFFCTERCENELIEISQPNISKTEGIL